MVRSLVWVETERDKLSDTYIAKDFLLFGQVVLNIRLGITFLTFVTINRILEFICPWRALVKAALNHWVP